MRSHAVRGAPSSHTSAHGRPAPAGSEPEGSATQRRPALALEGVRKTYPSGDSETVALDRADLTVGADEMTMLLGPSGSGKTTLLALAGGLTSPSEGSVVVGGSDIATLNEKQRARFRRDRVGFVFQSINLVPFLTARENLLAISELSGRERRRDVAARADRLLEELGLSERAGNLPAALSGGEQQRVAIGRALVNEPSLVLIDEPTSALDTRLGEQVMQLIRDEVKGRGVAAVIVTHDERMTRYADRVVRILDGSLSEAEIPGASDDDHSGPDETGDGRLDPSRDGAHRGGARGGARARRALLERLRRLVR